MRNLAYERQPFCYIFPEATDNLREIYSYIAFVLAEPDTAKAQIDRIREEIRSLNFTPSRYAAVNWEPWKSMGMRKVPVDNFVVYYTVNANNQTVTIIRIFYGGRNIEGIINAQGV